jgi:hypothetical protein
MLHCGATRFCVPPLLHDRLAADSAWVHRGVAKAAMARDVGDTMPFNLDFSVAIPARGTIDAT